MFNWIAIENPKPHEPKFANFFMYPWLDVAAKL
jgi:hypothetical protein